MKTAEEWLQILFDRMHGYGCVMTDVLVNDIRAIQADARASSVPEWQPIDTAPKDGTKILVSRVPATTIPPINTAHWAQIHKINERTRHGWKLSSKQALRYEPTHWMLLPPPPKNED